MFTIFALDDVGIYTYYQIIQDDFFFVIMKLIVRETFLINETVVYIGKLNVHTKPTIIVFTMLKTDYKVFQTIQL